MSEFTRIPVPRGRGASSRGSRRGPGAVGRLLVCAAFLVAAARAALADPGIEVHDVTVRLLPAEGSLEAEDRMLVRRDGGGPVRMTLNGGLEIARATVDGKPAAFVPEGGAATGSRSWLLDVPAGASARAEVVVSYRGKVLGPAVRTGAAATTAPPIGPAGALLSRSSGWVPTDGGLARFTVRPRVPEGWVVVTEGARSAATTADAPDVFRGRFDCDGVALAAGPWTVVRKRVGAVEIAAFLSEANVHAAAGLVDRAGALIARQAKLLGPWPSDRFDVVESPTGEATGAAEFVAVPASSLPEDVRPDGAGWGAQRDPLAAELLRCRWGRLVLGDPRDGGWAEPLVEVLAADDAADGAESGEAIGFRRMSALHAALGRRAEDDIPLRISLAVSGGAGDVVALARGAAFFHALRCEVGSTAFRETLRRVGAERRGARLGWDDWRTEFERTARRGLAEFFAQGLDRKGAPLLELTQTTTRADAGRFFVTGVLRQALRPGEAPWRLSVPVVVEHLEGVDETVLDVASEETPFSLATPSFPLRVRLDPRHDVLRRFAKDEVPACLAAALARPRVTIVAPPELAVSAEALRRAAGQDGATAIAVEAAPTELTPGTSWIVLGEPTSPLVASIRTRLPRHGFAEVHDPRNAVVVATSRSPADPAEFVTTIVGGATAIAASRHVVLEHAFDGRIVLGHEDAPSADPAGKDRLLPRLRIIERTDPPVVTKSVRLLLPDLKSAASPERAQRLVEKLAAPEMKGRLAGTPEEARARALVVDEFRLCGIEPEERPFAFSVKRLDAAKPVLSRTGGAAVERAVPLVASPETPEGGLAIVGAVEGDDADLAGRALVVEAGGERPLRFLRDVARTAVARKAAALFVRIPATPGPALSELWAFPERLPADVAARLDAVRAAGGDGDPLRHAARVAARTGADTELPLPVVAVPHDFVAAKDEFLRLDVRFGRTEIRSANVVARLRARGAIPRPGAVVLAARADHLGEGFPGADASASGVAALVEAANVLAAQDEFLARDVLLCVFGAEEWGLRGSRAFAASLKDPRGVIALVEAGPAGAAGGGGIVVVGASRNERLARAVGAAVEQSSLGVAPETDRAAFAESGAAWVFHEREIPAVRLRSEAVHSAATRTDLAATVDPSRVARIGQTLALAALAVAGGW